MYAKIWKFTRLEVRNLGFIEDWKTYKGRILTNPNVAKTLKS